MSSVSPSPFPMSRAASRASTAATSPPLSAYESEVDEDEKDNKQTDDVTEYTNKKIKKSKEPRVSAEEKFHRLDWLLERSTAYTELVGARMVEEEKRRQGHNLEADEEDNSGVKPRKRAKLENGATNQSNTKSSEKPSMSQPKEITGATLRDYQLQGVAWMEGLYQNGVNGILADEMGLGKTLQTIAFLAHLRESLVQRPFLIVCPLSVLHNWIEEFEKFAPTIPVCMYHGTIAERSELRKSRFGPLYAQVKQRKEEDRLKALKEIARTKRQARRQGGKRSAPDNGNEADEGSGEETQSEGEDNEVTKRKVRKMPVIVTTYEMIIKDAKFLAALDWGYIIVDEGHRLKNFEGKLIKEIKNYDSANRMILTGTPLHNNLAELWSLLNFILPDLFNDLDSFQEWFNLSAVSSSDEQPAISAEQSAGIVTKLHAILKPFLLRRVKADVEAGLPPKKEYVLYAPLSEVQRGAYEAVLNGVIRGYLLARDSLKRGEGPKTTVAFDINAPRKTRKKGQKIDYHVDDNDDEYFEKLEAGDVMDYREQRKTNAKTAKELGVDFLKNMSVKKINSLKLQNTVMQLRKVCSHPYLFDWPTDPETHEPVVDDQLVNASGKMMVLERLLDELFKRGHKVLLFSQFTTMLDILEEWAESFKGYTLCRIDGSTPPLERREQMNVFQTSDNSPSAPKLFLLSTRAGGLGINLTAADTVVFFDSDWNPQMDLQAQDRAHRIGQTRPVLVFRLVSAHTIESQILKKATARRKLEAMVIAKGKFRTPGQKASAKGDDQGELLNNILRLEGEMIEVVPNTDAGKAKIIKDEDLALLLDRSPAVFQDRVSGWTRETERGTKNGRELAFEVFETRADDGNDGLAKLFGEDVA